MKRRERLYAKAGADIHFVESPENEEMRRTGDSFDLPLIASMVERGRTPLAFAFLAATTFNKLVGFDDVWAFDRAHAD